MKQITNWASATVFDIEADDLLEGATKMHVLSYKMKNMEIKSIKGDDHSAIASFFKFHIEQGIPMVAHNGITYDVPLVEKILKVDLSKLMVVDTLLLSWALSPKRVKHGLDSFFDDYGIAKPPITDWQGLTYEEYENRCVEDVKINTALWDDLQARLIDMYSRVKDEVDSGNVGGSRTDEKEVLYIDRYVHTSTVADYIDRYISFLMYKGDSARLREKTKFKLDEEYVYRSKDTLEGLLELAKAELESIMPEVPQYKEVKFPKNPRKALTKKQINSGQTKGDLSAQGKKWNDTLKLIGKYDDRGTALAIHTGKKTFKEKEKVLADDGVTTVEITVEVVRDTISVLSGYNEPNANSPEQIKDFLYSKGWIPRTFKFVKDEAAMQAWVDGGFRGDKPKQRAIPQITVDGDGGKVLCESVEELAEESPEIARYATYGMIKHRLGLFKGFQRDVVNGHLVAGVAGYTNTLRDKHRELVNLPATGKPWGKELRGALVAGDGNVLLGSDMSALEDRVKHHFMLAHDPEYVETMTAVGYDPHLAMALVANLITEEQAQAYKGGERDDWVVKARSMGKTAVYACVYGAGAATIARAAGVDEATGKVLHTAYWKLNWSVKAIAEEQCVIKCSKGQLWLVNPINGFCYSLRAEKDIFSTLCQGTGSFLFDRWVDHMLELMYERFKVKRLSAAFHDELVVCFRDTEANRDTMEKLTRKAIELVNNEYNLRREMGCDVQFGTTYADIH